MQFFSSNNSIEIIDIYKTGYGKYNLIYLRLMHLIALKCVLAQPICKKYFLHPCLNNNLYFSFISWKLKECYDGAIINIIDIKDIFLSSNDD